MKFLGGPWTGETRAGTFARFLEAHEGLERAAFLDKVRSPVLAIGVELDPRTWDRGIVVLLDKASGPASEVVVGRGPDADVLLNCPTLSKRHVAFVRAEDVWTLTDLRSARGTTLEGAKIEPGKPVPLPDARPAIGLGGDVLVVFLSPARLFDLVQEAKAARANPAPPGPPPATAGRWPTWSLLQDAGCGSSTELELPRYHRPAVGAGAAAEVKPRERKPLRQQARELFSTPRRAALTLAFLGLIVVTARIWVWELLVLLFGETHPGWFGG